MGLFMEASLLRDASEMLGRASRSLEFCLCQSYGVFFLFCTKLNPSMTVLILIALHRP